MRRFIVDETLAHRLYFLFEQAAGNPVSGTAVGKIVYSIGLQQLVHHTALRDIQSKKTIFIEPIAFDEQVFLNGETVNGVILAERALVHPAVGKNKIILSYPTGTLKLIFRLKKNPGISDMDTGHGRLVGHLRYYVQPMLRIHLPLRTLFRLVGSRFAAQADDLNKKTLNTKICKKSRHAMQMINITSGNRINQAGAEAKGHCFLQVFRANGKDILTPERIIYFPVRAVKAET